MSIDHDREVDLLTRRLQGVLENFVGRPQSASAGDHVRACIKNLVTTQLLATFNEHDPDRLPFRIVCDQTNNTPTSISQGFLNFAVVDRITGKNLSPEEIIGYRRQEKTMPDALGSFYSNDPELQDAARVAFSDYEDNEAASLTVYYENA